MTSSPPSEALEFRGKTLTPVSPKPVHFPSPSNIPILERQEGMDPVYSDSFSFAQMNDAANGAGQPGQSHDGAPPASHDVNMYDGNASAAALPHPSSSIGLSGGAPEYSGASAGVDFQALLDNLSASASASLPPLSVDSSAANNAVHSPTPNSAISATAASLPPRPPPQAKPATHPNYAPSDDIRAYHPHSQKNPGASYRAQSMGAAPTGSAGVGANGLPPPPSASFQQQQTAPPSSASGDAPSPTTPSFPRPDAEPGKDQDKKEEDDVPWGPEVQKLYDEFLHEERVYVTEGQWDRFPANSRLFIGNLPTEKVTKRDLFHVFHRHGKLAQISIKQAYGFVQFLAADSCYRALQHCQGLAVRGRKMHLEISKPQRNTRNAEGRGGRRRSRSPEHGRPGRGVDRYTGNAGSPREREFRRGRDDYRPGRSPSPRGYRRGARRSPDRYDGRRRSRSRSPYGRRYRSPSPPTREADDDLPLPRRAPAQVPDVQIIVVEDLDRNFIQFIERNFKERDVRCDVLILSPRLSEVAVIRRQIIEGVQAVSRLTRNALQTGRIPLQVFDRRAGVDNVRYDEYDNLEIHVAAELVIRARQTNRPPPHQQQQPPPPSYGLPPAHTYGIPPQYGLPSQPTPQQHPQPPQHQAPIHAPAQGQGQDLSSIISSLDANGLQKLLGAMQSAPPNQAPHHPQQHQQPTAIQGLTPDLARLLGASAPPPQPHQHHQQHQPPQHQNPYAALANNPALASLLGTAGAQQVQQQTAQKGQPDMKEIMAQLSMYRR